MRINKDLLELKKYIKTKENSKSGFVDRINKLICLDEVGIQHWNECMKNFRIVEENYRFILEERDELVKQPIWYFLIASDEGTGEYVLRKKRGDNVFLYYEELSGLFFTFNEPLKTVCCLEKGVSKSDYENNTVNLYDYLAMIKVESEEYGLQYKKQDDCVHILEQEVLRRHFIKNA